MIIKDEIALAAAKWWAQKVDGSVHHDNGDNSPSSFLAMAIADLGNTPTTDDQSERFVDALAKGIKERFAEIDGYPMIDLLCDYSPCDLLHKAAVSAEVNERNFPFKTCMTIYEDRVVVRDGYGAPPEQIYP